MTQTLSFEYWFIILLFDFCTHKLLIDARIIQEIAALF